MARADLPAARGVAGDRAYGYERVIEVDAKGQLVRGLLEIDEAQAERRGFAAPHRGRTRQSSQNLLAGLANPAVRTMIQEGEAEKVRLGANGDTMAKPMARSVSRPALFDLFTRRFEALTATLDDASVHTKAVQVLSTLIESVTTHRARSEARRPKWSQKSKISLT